MKALVREKLDLSDSEEIAEFGRARSIIVITDYDSDVENDNSDGGMSVHVENSQTPICADTSQTIERR